MRRPGRHGLPHSRCTQHGAASFQAIDAENNITFHASLKQTKGSAEGTETFSSPKELGKLAAQWPGARLVEIWNSLPGVVPTKKFTSRELAVTRIWKAIQQLKPTVG